MYTIEGRKPIPQKSNRHKDLRETLEKMRPGQSILLPDMKAFGYANMWVRKHGMLPVRRKEVDGIRLWLKAKDSDS